MPTAARPARDVAAEDLADQDLGRALGLVAVADHPERDHGGGIVDRLRAHLEAPVLRRVETHVVLGLGDDRLLVEAMLADGAADGAGEQARLQRRHPHVAVELGVPRLLVGCDRQAQAPAVE